MDDPGIDQDAAAFADGLFQRLIGAYETLSLYVGDRLGLYGILAAAPMTAAELAERGGLDPRYAREWLEQQAAAGILSAARHDGEWRFTLPEAHAAVLTDPGSLLYSAPNPRMFAAAAAHLPQLLSAYRGGGGVTWAELGPDARDAQGDLNRPWFERELARVLASVAEVDEVLARRGARIADIGCGHGWSTIALARAHPAASVIGIDVDEPSLAAAREHAAGVANVSFRLAGGQDFDEPATYDAAFVFEALHDMPDPVGVLTALHRAVRDDGVVVIMDEAVAEDFDPDAADDVERIMYAYSLFVCLPDSMSTPGSVGTGTVMRPSTVERYARAAGFSGVEVLPIVGFGAFRFYRLIR